MDDRVPLLSGQQTICELAQCDVQLPLVRARLTPDKSLVFQFHTSFIHAKKAHTQEMGVGPKLHVRFVRFDWIVMAIASAGIEGITHPTEILEPGEVLRHCALGLSLHGRSGRRCTVLGHTATIRGTHGRRTVTTLLRSGRCAVLTAILGSGGSAIAVAGRFVFGLAVLLAAGEAELDVIQNDDGVGLLLAGLVVLDGLLVVAAGDVDERSFLQLHLSDPLTQVAGRLDAQVDVAMAVLAAAVIDTLADTEADPRYTIRLGETQGRTAIVPLTDADIGRKEFEHTV